MTRQIQVSWTNLFHNPDAYQGYLELSAGRFESKVRCYPPPAWLKQDYS